MVVLGIFLAIAITASDNRIAVATYSYILCSNCGGTGKADAKPCPRCEGARMVGALVDDELFAILGVEETPDFAQPVDEMLALLQV
jgi:hypothetical protein